MNRCFLIVAVLGLTVACSKNRTEQTSTAAASASVVAAPQAMTSAEPETRIADDTAATEADFEEEAERKITAQNLEAELDQLEKEITD